MASASEDEHDNFEEEERDVLPDLHDNTDTAETLSTSECRSVTSEDHSLTSDTELEDLEEVLRDQPKPKVIVFDLGKFFVDNPELMSFHPLLILIFSFLCII